MLNTPPAGISMTKQQADQIHAVESKLSYLVGDIKEAESNLNDLKTEIAKSKKEYVYQLEIVEKARNDAKLAVSDRDEARNETARIQREGLLKAKEIASTEHAQEEKRIELTRREDELKKQVTAHILASDVLKKQLGSHEKEKREVRLVKDALSKALENTVWS
jgi:hypothetical protein